MAGDDEGMVMAYKLNAVCELRSDMMIVTPKQRAQGLQCEFSNRPRGGRAMRIVFSNASSRWGGVHKVTEILTRGFLARGHDVRVFGFPGGMLEERMRGIAPFDPILMGMDFHPVVLGRAASALRKHRTEIVLMLMKKDVAMTGLAAYALRIPVVVRHANQQALGTRPHIRPLYGKLPAMHVTNAEATRETLLQSAPWLSPDRVKVIYNGVDPAPFQSATPLPLQLESGSIAIGYIGSFERRKGVIDLAKAWPRVAAGLPGAHLFLCGKGAMESEMRRLLHDAPRVNWLGYRSDVANVLRALDVLVLPSHVEGAPNIVLEAMAAGPSVVATRVSGTPELVRDGIEARLVPPSDQDALVRGIIDVGSNPQLREKMSALARRRVSQEFTIPKMLDSYEKLLSGIVADRAARGGSGNR